MESRDIISTRYSYRYLGAKFDAEGEPGIVTMLVSRLSAPDSRPVPSLQD
jgi:hypothetical protein